MTEELGMKERRELVSEIGRLRSGVLLSAWTVGTINEGFNPPASEDRRFELAEGQSLVLDLLADELSKVLRKLTVD